MHYEQVYVFNEGRFQQLMPHSSGNDRKSTYNSLFKKKNHLNKSKFDTCTKDIVSHPLWCSGWNILWELGQYRGCWCPGSMPPSGHWWDCHIGTSSLLTHWGRVTHICVSKPTIIGSDNGFSPGRRQAIIWTNAGILSFGSLGTNFSEMIMEIHTFSFNKMYL